jgi:multidrug resistance efflux pump
MAIRNKDIRTAINQAAHAMAQQRYASYKADLTRQAEAMLEGGASVAEIVAKIQQAAGDTPYTHINL